MYSKAKPKEPQITFDFKLQIPAKEMDAHKAKIRYWYWNAGLPEQMVPTGL